MRSEVGSAGRARGDSELALGGRVGEADVPSVDFNSPVHQFRNTNGPVKVGKSFDVSLPRIGRSDRGNGIPCPLGIWFRTRLLLGHHGCFHRSTPSPIWREIPLEFRLTTG